MGASPLAPWQRDLWYTEDYVTWLQAIRKVRTFCCTELRRRHGASPETLARQYPDFLHSQLLEMESALDRVLGGRPKWLYRFGLRNLVCGTLFGRPTEVARALVAARHHRSPRSVANHIYRFHKAHGLTKARRAARPLPT